ncbi:MAG TPA: hypothetical protein VJ840_12365 [Gemmatimonadaceae bacterium]|nr:hypothetical protein [Gemmatimonadaceae bacterium]
MFGARVVLALVPAFLFACASPPRLGPGEVSNSQLITEEEIDASRSQTAYDAIKKLRANFLSYRGETSFNRNESRPYPTVYLDDQEFGPIASLRTIPASTVATIRLYRSWEATTKFGASNVGGVIAITTRQ